MITGPPPKFHGTRDILCFAQDTGQGGPVQDPLGVRLVAIQSMRDLDIGSMVVNVNGYASAMGHRHHRYGQMTTRCIRTTQSTATTASYPRTGARPTGGPLGIACAGTRARTAAKEDVYGR
jgi:hypothetical protein